MENSFYRIFEYASTYMDGGDKTINFDGVKIIKDIPLLGLFSGAEYTTCWFNLEDMTFYFIVWSNFADNEGTYYPDDARSLKIKQSDLAQHCVW